MQPMDGIRGIRTSWLRKAEGIALGIGTGSLAIHGWLGWGFLLDLGWIAISAALILGGFGTALTRRLGLLARWFISEDYPPMAVILWGYANLMLGFGLGLVGLTRLLGLRDVALRHFRGRPGFPLIWLGTVVFAVGGAILVGPWNWRKGWWEFIKSIPYRILGIGLSLAGLTMLVLGLYEIFAPQSFDELVPGLFGF